MFFSSSLLQGKSGLFISNEQTSQFKNAGDMLIFVQLRTKHKISYYKSNHHGDYMNRDVHYLSWEMREIYGYGQSIHFWKNR